MDISSSITDLDLYQNESLVLNMGGGAGMIMQDYHPTHPKLPLCLRLCPLQLARTLEVFLLALSAAWLCHQVRLTPRLLVSTAMAEAANPRGPWRHRGMGAAAGSSKKDQPREHKGPSEHPPSRS